MIRENRRTEEGENARTRERETARTGDRLARLSRYEAALEVKPHVKRSGTWGSRCKKYEPALRATDRRSSVARKAGSIIFHIFPRPRPSA